MPTQEPFSQAQSRIRVLNPGTRVKDPAPEKTCMMQLGCGGRCACIAIPVSL